MSRYVAPNITSMHNQCESCLTVAFTLNSVSLKPLILLAAIITLPKRFQELVEYHHVIFQIHAHEPVIS